MYDVKQQIKLAESTRDLTFIPFSWRSPFTFERGQVSSPSQKGHVRRIAKKLLYPYKGNKT